MKKRKQEKTKKKKKREKNKAIECQGRPSLACGNMRPNHRNPCLGHAVGSEAIEVHGGWEGGGERGVKP